MIMLHQSLNLILGNNKVLNNMGKIVNVATIGTVHCVETNYKGKLQ